MGFCSVSACKNGGKCVNVESDYECKCPPKFEGKNCDRLVDKCKHPNNRCNGELENCLLRVINFKYKILNKHGHEQLLLFVNNL